jgi:hypothetical protein
MRGRQITLIELGSSKNEAGEGLIDKRWGANPMSRFIGELVGPTGIKPSEQQESYK